MGEGSYGRVYRGRLLHDKPDKSDRLCVVKLSKSLLHSKAITIDPADGRLSSHLKNTQEERTQLQDLAAEIDYAVLLKLGPLMLKDHISNDNVQIPQGLWVKAKEDMLRWKQHPGYENIHHIFEFDKEYIPCLISEFCDGDLVGLNAFLHKSGPEPGSNCFVSGNGPAGLWFEVVSQIWLGLQYMHSLDVAHNDTKPENVFFNWRDRGIQCFISDFGLCSQAKTQTRTIAGTPSYFSPELQTV